MQFGTAETSPRWGIAGFAGAPGWTVLQTAPLELLCDPVGRLGALARRLGRAAFQLNVYDGDSVLLLEYGPDGRRETSGFSSADPTRGHGGPPPEDRTHPRFRLIDARAAASAARQHNTRTVGIFVPRTTLPIKSPIVRAAVEARRAVQAAWLSRVGATVTGPVAHVDPADVVDALADGASFLGVTEIAEAVGLVFGGAKADNAVALQLVEHHPRDTGFTLFVE
jgi:hypothetical protein